MAEDGPEPFTLVGTRHLRRTRWVARGRACHHRHRDRAASWRARYIRHTGRFRRRIGRPDGLVDNVHGALDDRSLEVVSGHDDTAAKQADLHKDLRFFNAFLLAFAAVALFVGVFIIYNTFTIVLAQRSRELATLRLLERAGRRC